LLKDQRKQKTLRDFRLRLVDILGRIALHWGAAVVGETIMAPVIVKVLATREKAVFIVVPVGLVVTPVTNVPGAIVLSTPATAAVCTAWLFASIDTASARSAMTPRTVDVVLTEPAAPAIQALTVSISAPHSHNVTMLPAPVIVVIAMDTITAPTKFAAVKRGPEKWPVVHSVFDALRGNCTAPLAIQRDIPVVLVLEVAVAISLAASRGLHAPVSTLALGARACGAAFGATAPARDARCLVANLNYLHGPTITLVLHSALLGLASTRGTAARSRESARVVPVVLALQEDAVLGVSDVGLARTTATAGK